MEQLPPIPLDYRRQQPGSREPFVVQFFLGLLLGIGVSTLIWWFGVNNLTSKSPGSESIWIILLFSVPMAKGVAG